MKSVGILKLTVLNDTFQGVRVENESRASQFLTIQDEECGHTKWLNTQRMEEDDYVTVSHQKGVHDEVDILIEPNQGIAVGPAYNNYVGTVWTMVNGLKVIVRLGDSGDAMADVIVNPANSELCHGGEAARAISVAARKELDDECNEYVRQFGSVKVGKVMCTTAGNLKPRIRYVIHAVGPNACENNNR